MTGIPDVIPQRYEEHVELSRLVPHPMNPNQGDIGLVGELLAANGFAGSVLAQESTGLLIDGETRWRAARDKGLGTIPVIWLDCTDDTRDRLLASLNESTRRGSNDEARLVALLVGLAQTERGLEGAAFDGDDLDALIAALGGEGRGGPGLNGDPDDVPEPPAEPVAKRGDLWLLGEDHRLLCGDAMNTADVDRLMAGDRAVLMMTDPPYGVSYDAEWRGEMGLNPLGANRAGKVSNDDEADWTGAWVAAPADIAYVWHASAFADVVMASLRNANFQVRQQIIWVKPFGIISRQAYNWQHEPCWYAVRKGATGNWQGDHTQTTVWEAASPNVVMGRRGGEGDDKTEHPTQKPVALWLNAIGNHTVPGDRIYDPFAGSGSAVIAAHMTGRRAYVMDIDPAYCDLILARFEQRTSIKPERVLPDGTTEPVTFTGDHQ